MRANRSAKGIPQGSPISGVLANIYLEEFDLAIKQVVVDSLGGVYQRYSDDILIICPAGIAKEIYKKIELSLAQAKLKLGTQKTEAFRKHAQNAYLENITAVVEPEGNIFRKEAQYLGFHFDGTTISFRPSTLSRHVRGRRKPTYMKGAYSKTRSPVMARQFNKIRQAVKKK